MPWSQKWQNGELSMTVGITLFPKKKRVGKPSHNRSQNGKKHPSKNHLVSQKETPSLPWQRCFASSSSAPRHSHSHFICRIIVIILCVKTRQTYQTSLKCPAQCVAEIPAHWQPHSSSSSSTSSLIFSFPTIKSFEFFFVRWVLK